MRARLAAAVLFVAIGMPTVGTAQVYQFASPPPQVTAASAPWQIASEPIMVNGIVYDPTALVRQFDGHVMTQVGVFDGVPVYTDVTLEPFSVLYVPVARGMRTYERQRSGAFVGTTGGQAPFIRAQPASGIRREELPAPNVPTRPAHTRVETVPAPRATDGVWIRYDRAKWYSDGEAVPFTPERFTQVGTYHGFPVYRERNRAASPDIWVAVVPDGPVAPYAKRR